MLKTITYGLMHLTVAIAVAFALTRNWHAALAIGLIEPFVQTIASTVREKLWSRAKDQRKTPRCSHILPTP